MLLMGNSLSGRIEEFHLADVVHVIVAGKMSGSLNVTTDDNVLGMLYFDSGRLVHAQFGNVSGDDAATSILSWVKGGFSFDVNRSWKGDATVSQSFEQIVLNHTLVQDEDLAEIGHSISGTSKVKLVRGYVNPEVELDPSEWAFLTEIGDGASVAQIVGMMGLDNNEARRILGKLIKFGFVYIEPTHH
jgi:hypothetical protein